jgi:hypothetical protein
MVKGVRMHCICGDTCVGELGSLVWLFHEPVVYGKASYLCSKAQ